MNARIENPEEKLYTTTQAGKIIGMSTTGIADLCDRDAISYHWAGRRRMISESAIAAYLEWNSHRADYNKPGPKLGRKPWKNVDAKNEKSAPPQSAYPKKRDRHTPHERFKLQNL